MAYTRGVNTVIPDHPRIEHHSVFAVRLRLEGHIYELDLTLDRQECATSVVVKPSSYIRHGRALHTTSEGAQSNGSYQVTRFMLKDELRPGICLSWNKTHIKIMFFGNTAVRNLRVDQLTSFACNFSPLRME